MMYGAHLSFVVRAVYDVLPSAANFIKWGRSDDATSPTLREAGPRAYTRLSGPVHMAPHQSQWVHGYSGCCQIASEQESHSPGWTNPLPRTQSDSTQHFKKCSVTFKFKSWSLFLCDCEIFNDSHIYVATQNKHSSRLMFVGFEP